MTEVGFRRDGAQEWDAEEFMAQHELIREEEIISESSDLVQEKAEREMLEALEAKLMAIHDSLEDGQFLSVESKTGADYPRTRYDRPTTGDKAFTYTLDKPLKLGIWGKK
jgi:hypothetical protein